MASLVEEIQASAIDPASSISDMLRRVKLAAVKLQLPETIDWVDKELKGYFETEDSDLPLYRQTKGRLMERIPNLGVRPAFGDAKMIAMMSFVTMKEPISSIEALCRSEGDNVAVAVDSVFTEMLQQSEAFHERTFYVAFGKNVLFSILDSVRNLILDWAVALEQQGILGEGITFTVAEKEKAAAAGVTIHIGSLRGGFHQANVSGDNNRTSVTSDQSIHSNSGVLHRLSAAIESNVTEVGDKEAMLALVEQMKKEQGKPGFKLPLSDLMEYAANYVTVLGPFLPSLAKMLPV